MGNRTTVTHQPKPAVCPIKRSRAGPMVSSGENSLYSVKAPGKPGAKRPGRRHLRRRRPGLALVLNESSGAQDPYRFVRSLPDAHSLAPSRPHEQVSVSGAPVANPT